MMSIFAFCQTNYPAKIVWNNDTCVVISIPQLRLLNQKLLHRHYLLSQRDSLSVYTEKLKDLIWERDTALSSYRDLIISYTEKLNFQIRMNETYQRDIAALKLSNKKRGAWIWKGAMLGFGAGLLTFFIIK